MTLPYRKPFGLDEVTEKYALDRELARSKYYEKKLPSLYPVNSVEEINPAMFNDDWEAEKWHEDEPLNVMDRRIRIAEKRKQFTLSAKQEGVFKMLGIR